MLHEVIHVKFEMSHFKTINKLSHNVYGPHNDEFYSFLSKLEDEYSALKRSGYAGEGFFSPGHRLGTSHNVPPHIARLKAAEAAEKRKRTTEVMGSGGRLGGIEGGNKGLTPRELAARVIFGLK
jgi:hypothetical protein